MAVAGLYFLQLLRQKTSLPKDSDKDVVVACILMCSSRNLEDKPKS
jgi:hypothetical protein